MAIYTDLFQALKGEPLSPVFSSDGTLISASAAPHGGAIRRYQQAPAQCCKPRRYERGLAKCFGPTYWLIVQVIQPVDKTQTVRSEDGVEWDGESGMTL